MRKTIAWEVGSDGLPQRLQAGQIQLEKRLEDWVDADIEIAVDDVLLIGRQVVTRYGTKLDLLGVDSSGDLVIIELKRDQTLRETVAQGLEYAAWASKLGYSEVVQYGAQKYGGEDAFREAFEERFGTSLPETINEGQRILLVAPHITESTVSVIEYLSETYRVPINAVSFEVLSLDGRQILVRQVVHEEIGTLPPVGGKRQPARSREEFVALAHENHVGEAFEYLLELEELVPTTTFFVRGMRFSAKALDGKVLTVLNAFPFAETNKSMISLYVSPANLSRLYGASQPECEALVHQLQAASKPLPAWNGWPGIGVATLEQSEAVVHKMWEFISSTAKPDGHRTAPA